MAEMSQSEEVISKSAGKEELFLPAPVRCWDCLGVVEEFFCIRCGKIQPIPFSSDYFSLLGVEKRLQVDPQKIENRFYSLSRKFHPDFYQGRSKREQELSLENASALNKAYRTLRDPVSKIEYLFQVELGDGEGIRCQVPPDLLEEVLDLHSKLEEIHHLKKGDNPQEEKKIKQYLATELILLQEKFNSIEEQIESISSKWDQLSEESSSSGIEKKNCLLELRNILSQRTYLSNVIDDIKRTI